jgi:tRNA dimethylallyltransferase
MLGPYNCIVILGPTASGKTKLACDLALALNGEIISADSRQVYKKLDIGTGKDLTEYKRGERQIPYHLIDISEPGEQYYLHQFIADCEKVFTNICLRQKLPIICGGTGLYLDSLRKDYSFTKIPENAELRKELRNLSKEQLIAQLDKFPASLRAHVDFSSVKRIIRAIEVASQLSVCPDLRQTSAKPYRPYYIGIAGDLENRKRLISNRLRQRMENGLIEEVQTLLESGQITHERLLNLGLEYKFVSLYLQNSYTRPQMLALLETAIIQYAKRQMTWFRRMEKEGVNIHYKGSEIKTEDLINQLTEIFPRG